MATSVITGNYINAADQVVVGALVQFLPKSTPFVSGSSIVTSTPQSTTTDGSGNFSITLEPGYYYVNVGTLDGFTILVPNDGQPHNIKDITVIPLPSYPPPAGTVDQTLLTQFAAALSNTVGLTWNQAGDPNGTTHRFCVIGNAGQYPSPGATRIQTLVQALNPDMILSVGGNSVGWWVTTTASGVEAGTWEPPAAPGSTGWTAGYIGHSVDQNLDDDIGYYYHGYILGYTGAWGVGAASVNTFWPAYGRSDQENEGLTAFLNFFPSVNTANGGLTWYKAYSSAIVDVFMFDSTTLDTNATITSTSPQSVWLQAQLAASTAVFKIVVLDNSPYCSELGYHSDIPPIPDMSAIPFKSWGATMVVGGTHNHVDIFYERLTVSGLPCVVVSSGADEAGILGTVNGSSNFQYVGNIVGGLLMNPVGLIEATAYSLKWTCWIPQYGIIDTYTILAPNIAALFGCVIAGAGLLLGPGGLTPDFGYGAAQVPSGRNTLPWHKSGEGRVWQSMNPPPNDKPWLDGIWKMPTSPPILKAYDWTAAAWVIISAATAYAQGTLSNGLQQLSLCAITPSTGSVTAECLVTNAQAGCAIRVSIDGGAWFTAVSSGIVVLGQGKGTYSVSAFATLSGWMDSEVVIADLVIT